MGARGQHGRVDARLLQPDLSNPVLRLRGADAERAASISRRELRQGRAAARNVFARTLGPDASLPGRGLSMRKSALKGPPPVQRAPPFVLVAALTACNVAPVGGLVVQMDLDPALLQEHPTQLTIDVGS